MRILISAVAIMLAPAAALAQTGFETGPVIEDFGPSAAVPGANVLPEDASFNVSFDTREKAGDGEPNRTLLSAARFLNMHGRAGVDPGNIRLAVVVHGKAVKDVTSDAADSLTLITALKQHNVRIIVCGQSAAYYGVATEDLAPGVEMALSAMTAHALLQQDGYTLNPFCPQNQ